MRNITILSAILYSALVLSVAGFLWPYALYPLTIYVLSKVSKKKHVYSENYMPDVSIILPCFNEENTIKAKLDNILELDYPKELLHIILVDDGSTDKTLEFIQEYLNKGVTLLTYGVRQGKAFAMNAALSQTESGVVITTDADTYVDRCAIKHLVKHFSDPNVGVVGCNSLVKLPPTRSDAAGRSFLMKYEGFLKRMESGIDSSANLGGQLMAIRRDLAKFDESSIAEDFDCILNARTKGFRAILEPKALAWEYSPSTRHDTTVHQRRMSTGAIQTLFKYSHVLYNPKYGAFGVVILPGHRLSQLLNPCFLALTFVLSCVVLFLAPTLFMVTIVLFELLCIAAATISYHSKISATPMLYLNYFSIVQYNLLLSWIDFLKGRHATKWEKIESSRLNGLPRSKRSLQVNV